MTNAAWKALVAQGYDDVAERYLEWSGGSPVRLRQLDKLLALLPREGARVLELGCGAGVPATRKLAERHRVTAVDVSGEQILRARNLVPTAEFICADMMSVSFAPESFDAVAAIYSITHLPRSEHRELLKRIFGWLKPGGWFVASLGAHDSPNVVVDDWLGAANFFSHFDATTNKALVAEAGLELVDCEILSQDEAGESDVEFLWVFARRPAKSSSI